MNDVDGFLSRTGSSRSFFTAVIGALALTLTGAPRVASAEQLTTESSGAALPEPSLSSSGSGEASCTTALVPVKLTPLGLFRQNISVELCIPANSVRDTVLITVPGATYGHVYWDFPYDPDQYSFVRQANAAGFATLNMDRIGTGASDRPLSALVTLTNQAYVGHQLVEALRSGALGPGFSRVALVGHSLGSVISIGQVATYHDVDALVVTGYLHTFGLGLPAALPNVYPAMLDPDFATSGLDAGYLTTRPGTRGATFYYLSNADPGVIATDETFKETVTGTELAELEVLGNPAVSLAIDVPVLSIVGRWDSLFCMALPCLDVLNAATLEPLAYSPAAQLQLTVVPESGHDMNLQGSAPIAYTHILDWLDARFPAL